MFFKTKFDWIHMTIAMTNHLVIWNQTYLEGILGKLKNWFYVTPQRFSFFVYNSLLETFICYFMPWIYYLQYPWAIWHLRGWQNHHTLEQRPEMHNVTPQHLWRDIVTARLRNFQKFWPRNIFIYSILLILFITSKKIKKS